MFYSIAHSFHSIPSLLNKLHFSFISFLFLFHRVLDEIRNRCGFVGSGLFHLSLLRLFAWWSRQGIVDSIVEVVFLNNYKSTRIRTQSVAGRGKLKSFSVVFSAPCFCSCSHFGWCLNKIQTWSKENLDHCSCSYVFFAFANWKLNIGKN